MPPTQERQAARPPLLRRLDLGKRVDAPSCRANRLIRRGDAISVCDGNWQLRSMDRTPSLETSERNLRAWKKRACNHGQIRIDEDELGAHDFGLTAADT